MPIIKKNETSKLQKMFGKSFDNSMVITERPASLRSTDPERDKVLFREYRRILKAQQKFIHRATR